MCYVVLVYLLFALAVVCSDATFFFFFFSVQMLAWKTSVQILRPALVGPSFWAGATEWLKHLVLLPYATSLLLQTMNFTFKRSLISLFAQNVGVSRVRLHIDGANLHSWCIFFYLRCCHFLTTTSVSFFFLNLVRCVRAVVSSFKNCAPS